MAQEIVLQLSWNPQYGTLEQLKSIFNFLQEQNMSVEAIHQINQKLDELKTAAQDETQTTAQLSQKVDGVKSDIAQVAAGVDVVVDLVQNQVPAMQQQIATLTSSLAAQTALLNELESAANDPELAGKLSTLKEQQTQQTQAVGGFSDSLTQLAQSAADMKAKLAAVTNPPAPEPQPEPTPENPAPQPESPFSENSEPQNPNPETASNPE